ELRRCPLLRRCSGTSGHQVRLIQAPQFMSRRPNLVRLHTRELHDACPRRGLVRDELADSAADPTSGAPEVGEPGLDFWIGKPGVDLAIQSLDDVGGMQIYLCADRTGTGDLR